MSLKEEMIGKRFGRLTVLGMAFKDKDGSIHWTCICDCGNICTPRGTDLRTGRTVSCGCKAKDGLRAYHKSCYDALNKLVGKTFGELTIKKIIVPQEATNKRPEALCTCTCGNEISVRIDLLKSGHTKSCGCLRKKHIQSLNKSHGYSNTRMYRILHHMKQRCYNPKNKSYKYYGAKGIKICKEWLEPQTGFSTFIEWALQSGYSDELSIDRINVMGDYSPENCRWSTRSQQDNNRTDTLYITYKGKTQSLYLWAKELCINYKTLYSRLYNSKWSIEKAFTHPVASVRIKN